MNKYYFLSQLVNQIYVNWRDEEPRKGWGSDLSKHIKLKNMSSGRTKQPLTAFFIGKFKSKIKSHLEKDITIHIEKCIIFKKN